MSDEQTTTGRIRQAIQNKMEETEAELKRRTDLFIHDLKNTVEFSMKNRAAGLVLCDVQLGLLQDVFRSLPRSDASPQGLDRVREYHNKLYRCVRDNGPTISSDPFVTAVFLVKFDAELWFLAFLDNQIINVAETVWEKE